MKVIDLALHPRKAMRRYSPFRTELSEGQCNELAFLFTKRASSTYGPAITVRATSDPVVRQVYSQDAASLPANVDLLVKRQPGAVVMPADQGELLSLLKWADSNNVPLTPRAAGTSGYGGATPAESGVVVDMRLFNRILAVDKTAKTVRIQPSVVWMDLEKHLASHGLALRQYPTSGLFSTVGGWVAMGGGGVGSFEFGEIRRSVGSATVLHPDGTVKTYTGEGLDLVESAEGITGFIVEVTLKLRDASTIVPIAAAFAAIHPAAELVRKLRTVLGVHSVHILGPEFVALKQEAAGNVRHLPKGKHIVLAAVHADKATTAKGIVRDTAEALGGELVKDASAQWEWDTRFDHLNFKRYGPTVVAAEAVTHVDRLEKAWVAALDALHGDEEEKALWAIAINRDEFDLVGYLLADERIPNYPLSSGNALEFIHRVKKTGGRAYAPGMLLATEAANILGRDRVKKLAKWKRANDAQEIMNPGKVLQARVRGAPPVRIGMALKPGEPPLRWVRSRYFHKRPEAADPGLRAVAIVQGRILSPRLARLSDRIFACSRTGRTNTVGDLHLQGRFDTQMPRGVVRAAQVVLLGKAAPGPDLRSHVFSLPCVPSYDAHSQNGVPIFETIQSLREACVRAAGAGPETKAVLGAIATKGHPFDKGTRGDWLPGAPPVGEETSVWFVAGDSGIVRHDKAAKAAFGVLLGAGVPFNAFGKDEPTTLAQYVRVGAWTEAREAYGAALPRIQKAFKGRLPDRVIALSSEDAHAFRTIWPEVAHEFGVEFQPRVEGFAEACARLLKEKRIEFTPGDALAAVFVASPFAEPGETGAAVEVLKAAGVAAEPFAPGKLLIPDLAYTLVHAAEAKALVEAVKTQIDATHAGKTVVVACPDLAVVLAAGGLKPLLLPELVAQRIKAREGGAVVAAVVAEEEPKFKEHPIPEGHFRVELANLDAAIPVHPDEKILDAVEKFGMEGPFDCRAGSCVTCCARYEGTPPDQKEGQVLSAEEQKKYVLTCIAQPRGPVKLWIGEKPQK